MDQKKAAQNGSDRPLRPDLGKSQTEPLTQRSPEDPDEPLFGEPDDSGDSLQMWAPVTMMALFRNPDEARACAEDLEQRGLEAAVALFAPPKRPEEVMDPGLSSSTALGATLGATAGMLASSYFIPELAGPLINASPLFTTLAGAGLGSFVVGLAEQGGGVTEKAGLQTGVAVQVNPRQAAAAEEILRAWRPQQLEVSGR